MQWFGARLGDAGPSRKDAWVGARSHPPPFASTPLEPNGIGVWDGRYSPASNPVARPRSTETSRLTPRSTIVTPNRRCIRLIVAALWVTIR